MSPLSIGFGDRQQQDLVRALARLIVEVGRAIADTGLTDEGVNTAADAVSDAIDALRSQEAD